MFQHRSGDQLTSRLGDDVSKLYAIVKELERTAPTSGPVYLRYYGATVASTPVDRLLSDIQSNENRTFNQIHNAMLRYPGSSRGMVHWDIYAWDSEYLLPYDCPSESTPLNP